jgi:hypothetical protein
MSVSSTVSTYITATCDNPKCQRGHDGPTVVIWNVEKVKSEEVKIPEEAVRFITLTFFNNTFKHGCCPACAAEILGFPQAEITQKIGHNNLVHFPDCKKPLDDGVHKHEPEEGV